MKETPGTKPRRGFSCAGLLREWVDRDRLSWIFATDLTDNILISSIACPVRATVDHQDGGSHTGRPAGEDAFVSMVEDLTGRDVSKGIPGRPRKRPKQKLYCVSRISAGQIRIRNSVVFDCAAHDNVIKCFM